MVYLDMAGHAAAVEILVRGADMGDQVPAEHFPVAADDELRGGGAHQRLQGVDRALPAEARREEPAGDGEPVVAGPDMLVRLSRPDHVLAREILVGFAVIGLGILDQIEDEGADRQEHDRPLSGGRRCRNSCRR